MAHLSMSRIKVIMKSSADVDFVSKESVAVVAKATELFIKLLAQEGYENSKGGKKLEYKNLANVVHSDERFDFLREIMPKKITVLQYKQMMADKGLEVNKTTASKDSETDSESDSSSTSGGSGDSSDDEEEDVKKDDAMKADKTSEADISEGADKTIKVSKAEEEADKISETHETPKSNSADNKTNEDKTKTDDENEIVDLVSTSDED